MSLKQKSNRFVSLNIFRIKFCFQINNTRLAYKYSTCCLGLRAVIFLFDFYQMLFYVFKICMNRQNYSQSHAFIWLKGRVTIA